MDEELSDFVIIPGTPETSNLSALLNVVQTACGATLDVACYAYASAPEKKTFTLALRQAYLSTAAVCGAGYDIGSQLVPEIRRGVETHFPAIPYAVSEYFQTQKKNEK